MVKIGDLIKQTRSIGKEKITLYGKVSKISKMDSKKISDVGLEKSELFEVKYEQILDDLTEGEINYLISNNETTFDKQFYFYINTQGEIFGDELI